MSSLLPSANPSETVEPVSLPASGGAARSEPTASAWREGYRAPPDVHDEWLDADGNPRPHTARLSGGFEGFGPPGS